MTELVDAETGQRIVEDDPARVRELFLSRQAGFRPDQRVAVIRGDGFVGTIEASDLAAIYQSGGRTLTDAEIDEQRREERFGRPTAQFLGERFIAGETFGLSDVWADLVGPEYDWLAEVAVGGLPAFAAALGGEPETREEAEERRREQRQRQAGLALGVETVGGIYATLPFGGLGAGARAPAAVARGTQALRAARAATTAEVVGGAAARAGLAETALGRAAATTAARVSTAPLSRLPAWPAALGRVPTWANAMGRVPGAAVSAERAATQAARGLAGQSLASRVGQTALRTGIRGAAEAQAFEMQQMLSDATVNQVPLDAERVAARMTQATLIGGGAGGILGGAGRLTGAGFRRLQRELMDSISDGAIRRQINRLAFRALGPQDRQIEDALRRRGGTAAVARVVLQPRAVLDGQAVMTRGSSLADMYERAGIALQDAGEEIGRAMGRIDDAAWRGRIAPSPDQISDRVRREVFEHIGDDGMRRRVETAYIDAFDAAAARETGAFARLHRTRAEIDRLAYPGRAALAREATPFEGHLRELRGVLEDELESGIRRVQDIQPGLINQYQAAKGVYENLRVARDILWQSSARDIASSMIPMRDLLVGGFVALSHGNIGGVALGIMSGTLLRFLRRNGHRLAALGLNRAGATMGIRAISDQAARRVGVATNSLLTQNIRARATTDIQTDRFPAQIQATLDRPMDHDALANRLSAGASGMPEDISARLAAVAAAAQRGLLESMPAGTVPPGYLMPHLLEPGEFVSDFERAQYLRFARIVEEPERIMDDIESGNLSVEAVEALRRVYPLIYDDVVETVSAQLAQMDELPPYAVRLQLGILFPEIPTDPTLTPDAISRLQEPYLEQQGAGIGGQMTQQAQTQPQVPRTAPRLHEDIKSAAQRDLEV